jgi:hypothetical protein
MALRLLRMMLPPPMTPSVLAHIIEQWTPSLLTGERAYQTALYEYLLTHLSKDSVVKKNYPQAGMDVDLFVRLKALVGSWEVFIELKYNLTTSECDRLIGQLRRLGLNHNIIIVLIGDAERANLVRLQDEFTGYLTRKVTWGMPSMFIVNKGKD